MDVFYEQRSYEDVDIPLVMKILFRAKRCLTQSDYSQAEQHLVRALSELKGRMKEVMLSEELKRDAASIERAKNDAHEGIRYSGGCFRDFANNRIHPVLKVMIEKRYAGDSGRA